MLSYQRIVCLQWGQCERGLLMLRWSGRREIQTFRKLPKSSPRMKAGSSKARGDSMNSSIGRQVLMTFFYPPRTPTCLQSQTLLFSFQHGKGGWSKPMKIDCSSCSTQREVTEA